MSDYSSGHYIKVIYCRVEVAAAAAAAAAFVNDKMHVDLNRERKGERESEASGKWQVRKALNVPHCNKIQKCVATKMLFPK